MPKLDPGPPSLEELYREAKADLDRGGPDLALKWAFKHAKQTGRVAAIEKRSKLHAESYLYYLGRASFQAPGEEEDKAIAGMQMGAAAFGADCYDLEREVAAAKACEMVMQLARTRQQPAQPKPNLRAVPGGKP